ncbi:MAG: HlyD family efflux transporter periplasmic adaptor subunit [Candidatus Nanopelagicales bacterium]
MGKEVMSLTPPMYRPEATAELDAGKQLDNRLRTTSVRIWLALLALVAVILAGIAWGVFGSAPQVVVGRGAILPENGLVAVRNPVAGRIESIEVERGQEVTRGTPLMILETAEAGRVEIDAAVTGEIVQLVPRQIGTWLSMNELIAQIVPQTEAGSAIVFVEPSKAAQVKPGMTVHVSPDIAPAGAYGSIVGTVASVDPIPSDAEDLILMAGGNEALAQSLGIGGTKVVLQLNAADTTSGYEWTSGSGPDFAIPQVSIITATIIINERHPLAFVTG